MATHKNKNSAIGNYGIYQIVVEGKTYKIGKADLDRITLSSGNPTRIHQQIRKLSRKYAKEDIIYSFLGRIFSISTKEAKKLEKALLEDFYQRNGFVPEGNQKSFKP
jgi:hypothetical protein